MGWRILIVEDTPENMYALKRVFEHAGFEALEAVDGEAAIRQNEKERPDAILMDMRLPRLSGYEAAERIHQAFPALPIVAITADALPGDRERCMELGCIAYFSKPIRYREIVETVRKVLEDPSGAKAAPDENNLS
jgi:two-component system, sensor histidine kinase